MPPSLARCKDSIGEKCEVPEIHPSAINLLIIVKAGMLSEQFAVGVSEGDGASLQFPG